MTAVECAALTASASTGDGASVMGAGSALQSRLRLGKAARRPLPSPGLKNGEMTAPEFVGIRRETEAPEAQAAGVFMNTPSVCWPTMRQGMPMS